MNEPVPQKIEDMRHSLAHLLAAAVLELWPDTKPTIGPPTENGFYYDFDFREPIGSEHLPTIEAKMREILPSWEKIEGEAVNLDRARELFKDNPYKLELIEEIASRGEPITVYHSRVKKDKKSTATNYYDLCKGGHAVCPSQDIDPQAFTLSHVAGAYWRGSEKNKMLTRLYGLAFATKQELDGYLKRIEDAQKRDHKKLGVELDLFTFSELVGPGLPLWTPKGAVMREVLNDFVWKLRKEHGYQKVEIPHIAKRDLYEKSGHWDKFKDELFKIKTREGHEFAMKPMNCPHHIQIFKRRQWSWRETPLRYANTTMVYRDEQSGELAGLARVRAITQDDAHVFCRYGQIKQEIAGIWNMVKEFYGAVGFELTPRLSLHDPQHPEKYLGDADLWHKTEEKLREIAHERGENVIEMPGEAAFYGPKLDFLAHDSLGRDWQVATIQLDMNLPERFDLYCINEHGNHERIAMIHTAIMGAIERYMAILIEHFAGAFPFWLAPVQVVVMPIGEAHKNYALEVYNKLKESSVRAELNDRDETLNKKIREARLQKIPYYIIIGNKELDMSEVTLESRDRGKVGQIKIEELINQLKDQ